MSLRVTVVGLKGTLMEELIARVSPYFSAVTPVLVGDGPGEDPPPDAIRLPVGCDVAAGLIALD